MSFARTKIQIPSPRAASLVARLAIEAALGQAMLESRLVLVCAAAGYGKTTALARVAAALPAHRPGTAVAWIGCDDGDSLARLLECLVAALEPLDPPWRSEPEALVRVAADAEAPAQRRQLAEELINVLDACELPHGVIVVDDLHRVRQAAVHEFLDALLERLSPRWTLVLATRVQPPLALPRLRARGEVAEFSAAELRFERDEARALVAAHGLDAGDGDRLLERTQGWPAGLRLGLSAARGHAGGDPRLTRIDRHVFDFLAAEVIDQLDAPLRHFLLSTSLLPELTAARGAALSGDAQAAQRLEEIERAGLFVTRLEAAEPTLRLHDLFREALQARLVREQPTRLRALLHAAATTEADLPRRVAWLQRAEDWAAAAEALAAAAPISQGQSHEVRVVLEAFPPEVREGSPGLQVVMAQLAWARWDWAGAIRCTAQAARLFDAAGAAPAARLARSFHCIALAGANHADAPGVIDAQLADPALEPTTLARTLVAACWVAMRGDQRLVAPTFTRVLQALQSSDDLTRWYECAPLPPFVGLPGTRVPLERYLAEVQHVLPEQPTPLRGMCHVVRGWLALWQGDVASAEAAQQRAADDARWLARPVNVDTYQRGLLAVLRAVRGDAAGALDVALGLVTELQAAGTPMRAQLYLGLYLHGALRCAAIGEDLVAMADLARRLSVACASGPSWLSVSQQASAAAYAALAAGDLVEACARWRAMLAQEHAADLYGQVAEARLRLADALQRRGRGADEAAAVLRPLLQGLDESGEWGALLMAGPACLTRLSAHDWDGRLGEQGLARLQQWAERSRSLAGTTRDVMPLPSSGPRTAAGLPAKEPLTPREREVLACMAAGDSNKLIARRFDLSPHTVKRHVANILDKLDLSTRGQAAAWYHQQQG